MTLIQYRISSDYVFGLFEMLEQAGKSPIDVCSEIGLIVPKSEMVSLKMIEKLVDYFYQELELSHAGLLLGLKQGVNQHGLLGFAAKASQNLAAALEVDEQYLATRIHGVNLSVTENGPMTEVSLFIDEPVKHLSQFIVEMIIGSLISFYAELFPKSRLDAIASVTYRQPENSALYNKLTRLEWRFSQNKNALIIPTEKLLATLPASDLDLQKLLISQCEQALETNVVKATLTDQVAMLLKSHLASPPKVNDVAVHFGLNERTLKRKLSAEGESYRNILSRLRVDKARQLLTETGLSIDDVAHQVGYASPNTFKRLFKQWTGDTPGSVRNKTI